MKRISLFLSLFIVAGSANIYSMHAVRGAAAYCKNAGAKVSKYFGERTSALKANVQTTYKEKGVRGLLGAALPSPKKAIKTAAILGIGAAAGGVAWYDKDAVMNQLVKYENFATDAALRYMMTRKPKITGSSEDNHYQFVADYIKRNPKNADRFLQLTLIPQIFNRTPLLVLNRLAEIDAGTAVQEFVHGKIRATVYDRFFRESGSHCTCYGRFYGKLAEHNCYRCYDKNQFARDLLRSKQLLYSEYLRAKDEAQEEGFKQGKKCRSDLIADLKDLKPRF